MRKIITIGPLVVPCVVGCDAGEYLSVMELLSNDSIVTGVVQIISNLIAGVLS